VHKLIAASLALALASPLLARADSAAPAATTHIAASDLAALRQEIATLRASYEARLQSLEQRLQQAETKPSASTVGAGVSVAPVAAAAPVVSVAPATSAAPAEVAAAGGGTNAFNPSISLILSGLYARSSQEPAQYAISGFQLPPGAEIGPGTRGFSLTESELGFAASIDPWLRGAANISLHPDDTVSVEEAYVQTTSLGHGLSVKAGRCFSGIGYLNPQHSHTWDFVDNPLAYQALLGTQHGDDGVQLAWLPPLDNYVEIGAELGRGRSFPGSDTGRNGAGMGALYAHAGGDMGDSSSWRAGLSMLDAKASAQTLAATNAAGASVENSFTGSSRVWVADAIWKWAPNGNATRTSVKLQGEYLRGRRNGTLVYDVAGAANPGVYRATQSGWYLQTVYQFMPHWRVGARTERLDPGSPDYGINAASLAGDGFKPSKQSLMLDFSPSEFSRVRLQFARDRAREGVTDNQVFLQYQTSLGAHGAHSY